MRGPGLQALCRYQKSVEDFVPDAMLAIRLLSLLMAATGCRAAWAQPSVPWTPSDAGRHAIELLVDDAGLDLTTTQWPLPHAAVERAVDALPAELPLALDAARARVRHELRAHEASGLEVTLRGRAEGLPGFGDDATPGSSLAVRSSVLDEPWVAMQIGGRIESRAKVDQAGTQFRLDDSAVATEAFGIQLQAWSHRNWWSPGWQSALGLSNNAPAFNGVGIQRASASTSASPWLAWLGPWNFDVFVAQTEDVTQPANPFLFGGRVTLRPFSHVEIGLTKMAQWGGRGRPESPGSFLDMLIGAHTNAETVDERGRDPENGLAGFDLRMRCPTRLRCAAYTQWIGEDVAAHVPKKYLDLYGVEFWSADGDSRFFAEYAETGCRSPIGHRPLKDCAYRNYAYPQGYASAGRWIGASVGPDSRLLTLGWLDVARGRSWRVHFGSVGSRVGTYSALVDDPQFSGHLIGISARQDVAWGASTLRPELDLFRMATPSGVRTQARIGARLSMNLDGAVDDAGSRWASSLSASEGSAMNRAMVGAGLVALSALLDHTLDDYAQHHGGNPSSNALVHVGEVLPFAGFAAAGLSWIIQRGSALGDVGFDAVGAGIGAAASAELIKVVVDRARPQANLGAANFGHTSHTQSSFPSIHSALAWAVATPYARHYDAPWLYGAAALTSAARVVGRKHWLSDTVGGAVLGYGFADYFYRRSDAQAEGRAASHVWVTPGAVVLHVPFD